VDLKSQELPFDRVPIGAYHFVHFLDSVLTDSSPFVRSDPAKQLLNSFLQPFHDAELFTLEFRFQIRE
jgi:hypothetical protein